MKRNKFDEVRTENNGASIIRKLFALLKAPKKVFTWIKKNASDDQLRSIAAMVTANVHPLSRYLYGTPFPVFNHDLYKNDHYPIGSFSDEFRWILIALTKHRTQVHEFIEAQRTIQRHTILADYDTATSALDKYQKTWGTSLFAIQYSLLLAELRGGLNANAELLASIQADSNQMVRAFALYYSMRAERNVSAARYKRRVGIDLSDPRIPANWKTYLQFRLNYFDVQDTKNLAVLLNLDFPLSLVDRYSQFTNVSQLAACEMPPYFDEIKSGIAKLNEKLSDPILDNIAIFCRLKQIDSLNIETRSLLDVHDLYYMGNYRLAAKTAIDAIVVSPLNFDLYRIYIQCLILLDSEPEVLGQSDSFCNVVISAVWSIYTSPSTHLAASEDLAKVVATLGDNALTKGIMHFLVSEQVKSLDLPIQLLKCLSTVELMPELAFCFDEQSVAQDFINSLIALIPNSLYLNLLKEYFTAIILGRQPTYPADVTPSERTLWEMRAFARTKSNGEIARTFNAMKSNGSGYRTDMPSFIVDEILNIVIEALIQEEKISDAASEVVDALLWKPWLATKFPVERLLQKVESNSDSYAPTDINIPILYALSDVKARSIYIAYDNFLSSVGVSRPTEFMRDLGGFDLKRVIAFLDKVCVQKVLSGSYHFDGTDDLEQERLQICQKLSQINPNESKKYSAEINSITERIMIRRGMQQIEESRIYVDEAGIRTRGRKLFLELFERFKAFNHLRTARPDLRLPDATRVFSHFATNEDGQLVEMPAPAQSTVQDYDKVLHVASIGHFRDLFFEVRNRFISNNEHGLDAYLSTRVRHGTLEGHVRSIFERLNLIAQRDKAAGIYLEEKHWNGRLGNTEDKIASSVQTLIAEFSTKIDFIIDYLKGRVVQVYTEKQVEPEWLDFSYSDGDLVKLLTERFETITTYDEHMDTIFQELWFRTNIVLERTRNKISTDIKSQVYNALLEFLSEIRRLIKAEHAPELHGNITKGFTDLQTEFAKLAEWFTISHSTLLDEFTVSNVIAICVASINNIYPTRTLHPIVHVEYDEALQGRYFAHFSDIFRTIFDNIVVHSGLTGDQLHVRVAVTSDTDILMITVIHALSEEVFNRDPVSILKERLDLAFKTDIAQAIVRSEGGSGVAKIVKILQSDLARKRTAIAVQYSDGFNIEMKIELELEGLLMA